MNVPHYISPIVGHRSWRWDGVRLLSVSGVPWLPGQVFKASCFRAPTPLHQAPQMDCTCGVYAIKTGTIKTGTPLIPGPHRPAQLQKRGLTRRRLARYLTSGPGYRSIIGGEVYLWGTVVEHEDGWRAQFAYPKSLTLLSDDTEEMVSAVAAYGTEVGFIDADELNEALNEPRDVKPQEPVPAWEDTGPLACLQYCQNCKRWVVRGHPCQGAALAV